MSGNVEFGPISVDDKTLTINQEVEVPVEVVLMALGYLRDSTALPEPGRQFVRSEIDKATREGKVNLLAIHPSVIGLAVYYSEVMLYPFQPSREADFTINPLPRPRPDFGINIHPRG